MALANDTGYSQKEKGAGRQVGEEAAQSPAGKTGPRAEGWPEDLGAGKGGEDNLGGRANVEVESTYIIHLPGMILSGPFLEVISVNSLRILAAFFASDFKLEGIGLFTKRLKK